jgi:hypothetical protein
MAAAVLPGQRSWSMTRDEEGHRTYRVVFRVRCDPADGPATVLAAAGLPRPGDPWVLDNDSDPWAWCRLDADVKPVYSDEPCLYFDVEQTFSSKPPRRDPAQPLGDPLLEPFKVSGGFTKTTEEAARDRWGRAVANSAHEMLRGKHVEFDTGMATIKLDQNLAALDLSALVAAYQTVNALPMWGLPPRTIKLANASWGQQYYTRPGPGGGAGTPAVYYSRSLDFEISYKGWDKLILDEGTKVLKGEWRRAAPAGSGSGSGSGAGAGGLTWVLRPVDDLGTMPDPNNPQHFIRSTDLYGNPMRIVLNGAGVPAGTLAARSQQFLAILANAGTPLSDSEAWVPVISPPDFVLDWRSDKDYLRGDLVFLGDRDAGQHWVALRRNTGRDPTAGGNERDWFELLVPLNDRGLYDPTVAYAVGDVVRDSQLTAAGLIAVQYYQESDFSLLGLPLALG